MARRRTRAKARVVGFYTDEKGKVRPITARSRKRFRPKTIFFPAKHKKYAEIVKISSPEEAKVAVKMLTEEFEKKKSKAWKRKIKSMMVLAANRAAVAARNPNLSEKERREFKEVERIYREAYKKLKIE